MQRLKTAVIALALTGAATAGLGTTSAIAATTAADSFTSVTSTDPPQPAYDPCPAGYTGEIVGYDDNNSTGKRVYACIKTHP